MGFEEHSQPARVDERHPGQVDAQIARGRIDQLGLHEGAGDGVDFAGHSDPIAEPFHTQPGIADGHRTKRSDGNQWSPVSGRRSLERVSRSGISVNLAR